MTDNTLNKFGHSFQVKVLSSLITDRNFTAQVVDILESKYFDSESLKWLINGTFNYFKEYRLLPTLDVFKVQLSNLEGKEVFKAEVIKTLGAAWKDIGSDDLPYIKEKTVEFCRHQTIIKAFETGVGLIPSGKYDEAASLIVSATRVGTLETNNGLDYMTDVDYRYAEVSQSKKIPTGWQVIDDITAGGLSGGKLGVFIAGPGGTKSWHLMCLGAHAIKKGFNVLHYTLELDEIYVGQRYDSILTGIQLDDLKYHLTDIKKTLSKYTGKLLVKFFPTKSVSINGLKQHIEKQILNGFKPDLIVLDYADLLKLSQNPNLRKDEVLQELYEELRGLAGELDVPVWTVSQVRRSGSSDDVIGGDSISESFGKMFTADFVASISRKSKDKINNTGRMHIIKNRLGPDGLVFPERIDTSRGLIEIYDEASEKGKKVQADMVSDQEYSNQIATKRFEQIMSKPKVESVNDLF